MSAAFSFILFILYFLPPIIAGTCPISAFRCGAITLDMKYPFFTNATTPDCRGLYFIECLNLAPMIKFPGQEFFYPVLNISYTDRTLVIHDLKLSLSPYPWGSDCVFFYNFINPIPHANVTELSLLISSNQFLFNCRQRYYDSDRNIFDEIYNTSLCKDYALYYTYELDSQPSDGPPAYCATSGPFWFGWKLSFSEDGGDGGGFSLLSAGFSRNWELQLDCFDCRITSGDCNGGGAAAGDSSCGCNSECRGGRGKKNNNKTIGVIAGISSFILVLLFFFLYFWRAKKFHNLIILCRKKSKIAQNIDSFLEKYGSLAPKRYKYSDVKKMTKSFRDKLGQGGYGVVYKGKLHDGHLVAVKVLSGSKSNGEEFVNEVASIGGTSHVNVVSLLGFCYEGSRRALIYDFMPNGSLEKHIYNERLETIPLGLEILFKIAVGIARGLEYLHRGCNTRIVHFDIKPHNILLDQDFCPKISDFGLALLCRPKESIISMCGARGTVGYIAPEVFSRNFGVISGKSDVYSYGMMVLEMVGGRRNVNATAKSTSETYFPHWIYEHLDQIEDQDERFLGTLIARETKDIARKMAIVGLWCIQTMPENRPSISRVLEMLEGSISGLQMPPKPYLFSPDRSFISSSTVMIP